MGKKRQKKRPRETAAAPSHATPLSPPPFRKHRPKHPRHTSPQLPLELPSHVPFPKHDFLRDEPPYQESFQTALDTSYEGFAVDSPTRLRPHVQKTVPQALQTLERHGFFRTDVTQPFGLGTKCAKTYVTRCLLGNVGTTYRYLGLRMFSYPWNQDAHDDQSSTEELHDAVATLHGLNHHLTERTECHLDELTEKRTNRGAEPTRGRAGFDIALINRMENGPDLKKEPMVGNARCSVSWHADSSLEHFSTIAVYHTIQKSPNNTATKDAEGSWSVALRVAHHSEGPIASHRAADVESSIATETPPLSVSLPSGSAYYLLDDFNHHHQHAVLASGGDAGIRFSSTHRLLRESHNVDSLLERCRTVCGGFHKKGPKIWRSEQLLLTEMESEWIRQFYIQGQTHYDSLWKSWGDSMRGLLRYWSQLESRTKQTIDLLAKAAMGHCISNSSGQGNRDSFGSRRDRTVREKQKKAASSLQDIIDRRVGHTERASSGALECVYDPLATLLDERARMRELWLARESDEVFSTMDLLNRPIPIPFVFDGIDEADLRDEFTKSPLEGSPEALRKLASSLRAYGRAFDTGELRHLPEPVDSRSNAVDSASDHNVSLDWGGWRTHTFGLEMQDPWAELLLEGKKKVETRAYDLPPALQGRRIEILQANKGVAGKSSIGDVVSMDPFLTQESPVRRVGWCTFKRTVCYKDRESFEADEDVHLVKRDSGFGWEDGVTRVIFGWAVGEKGRYNVQNGGKTTIVRRKRSLFEIRSGGTNMDR